jgi:3-methyladenine DNA glycosylase/8-oxoguanine DNA glycosylase
MYQKKLSLRIPKDFSFWRTVLSHGWCVLPPFHVNRGERMLERILQGSKGLVLVEIREQGESHLEILVKAYRPISREDTTWIGRQIAYLLRLEESLQCFFQALLQSKDSGKYGWITRAKAGRMLRSPSIFEDVVKMICTTNCSWSATERMVDNLVQKLGTRFDQRYADFPTPEQLAATSEHFLIREVRTGYRSAYLIELAERVAGGKLNLNLWPAQEGGALYKQLLSIKGIGPYAAGNLLKLLGHYEHLALDSWCRAKFAEIHWRGKRASDRVIANYYKHYGCWSGLVMWLDLTRDWFDDEESQVS